MRAHLAHRLALLRWLGPWARPGAAPRVSVTRRDHPLPHLVFEGARSPRRTVLLLPGLHFLGPEDLRFQRLAAILADRGARVVAPFLSDFLTLTLSPRLLAEAEAALLSAHERARGPVGVMSISFGSIAALHLAAHHPELVDRVVVFGGYRDLERTFRFALGGEDAGLPAEVRDPLNGPAVLANLADELLPEHARAPFRAATLEFSRRTWSRGRPQGERGRADDKRDGRHLREGEALSRTLDGEARALFRVACRLEGDPLALAASALPRAKERIAFLDPTPLVPRVRAEVTCLHGRDDDVIPWTEAEALARDLPNARALVTGLYGHTGHAARPGPRALASELATMLRVIDALGRLVAAPVPG